MPKGFCYQKKDERPGELKALILDRMNRMDINRRSLAEKINIPYSSLIRYINKPEVMDYGILIKIVDALKFDAEQKAKIL